jgi:hypothetical protein
MLPPAQRSKVTNGRRLFADGGNLNGVWARRFRDVQFMHLSDLGGSGHVSAAEESLVRRVATLTIELERLEAKLSEAANPDPAALDLYQRMTNTLRRTLETLGTKRRARDVNEPITYVATEYENP